MLKSKLKPSEAFKHFKFCLSDVVFLGLRDVLELNCSLLGVLRISQMEKCSHLWQLPVLSRQMEPCLTSSVVGVEPVCLMVKTPVEQWRAQGQLCRTKKRCPVDLFYLRSGLKYMETFSLCLFCCMTLNRIPSCMFMCITDQNIYAFWSKNCIFID